MDDLIRHKDRLHEYSLSQIRQQLPHVQKRVYEALLNLSPEQLEFEFELLPGERSFCMTYIDWDTYEIIGHVMSCLLEQENLILTMDDVRLCYTRFRELMYLKAAVDQGILRTEMTDNGLEYYYVTGDIEDVPPEQWEEKIYVARPIHRYRGIG